MPYLAHFALQQSPFTLTPNTAHYYPFRHHEGILDSLVFGVRRNGGIFKVTGDVGTGKTMLCRLLLKRVAQTESVAYLNAPNPDRAALLKTLCREFGLPDVPSAEQLEQLNAHFLKEHEAGRTAVLIVDEAQALEAEGLETIRLLSNLETEQTKLLQIVLFGQNELDALLNGHGMRQLKQRIAFSFNTGPVGRNEVRSYILHRLSVARVAGVDFPIFTKKALSLLAYSSRGIPRVVNILADKALLAAYGAGDRDVEMRHVLAAIDESRGLAASAYLFRPIVQRMAQAATILAVIGSGVLFGASSMEKHVDRWMERTAFEWLEKSFANSDARQKDEVAMLSGVTPYLLSDETSESARPVAVTAPFVFADAKEEATSADNVDLPLLETEPEVKEPSVPAAPAPEQIAALPDVAPDGMVSLEQPRILSVPDVPPTVFRTAPAIVRRSAK